MDTEIFYNSVWFHLGSLLFTSIGFTNDIFKIRLLLIGGNLFMLLNALLGWPAFPDVIRKPVVISWDSVVWPVINISINLYDIWKDYREKNNRGTVDDEEN